MPIAAVVGDANVLLSAVIGKAALRVITEFGVDVHVARFNADEVETYLAVMAEKYALPGELVALQWRLLPLRIHSESAYRRQLTRARRDLASRDPDDAHPLALARALALPLWTNDRDLAGHGVDCFPTAKLLRELEGR
jgi:predicted nucleic acid-binding protein